MHELSEHDVLFTGGRIILKSLLSEAWLLSKAGVLLDQLT